MESDGEDDKLTLADLAEAGMMAELKLLLESETPIDVNEKSPDDDFTALHWSCLKGNLPVRYRLLFFPFSVYASLWGYLSPLIFQDDRTAIAERCGRECC